MLLKIFHLVDVLVYKTIPYMCRIFLKSGASSRIFMCIVLVVNLFNNYSSTRMGSKSIANSASWAIDSEAMRARGIIVFVKSNYLVKNIENKKKLAS